MEPSVDDLTGHRGDPTPPGATPCVGDYRPRTDVVVVPPDPSWPAEAARLTRVVSGALGVRVLELQHVGSTAVPGLPAKPVIDLDLVVADPAEEPAYVPDLERVGFRLVVREPWWQEHRSLVTPDRGCNLHVFGPGAAEPVRHRIFRDWLRAHPAEAAAYAEVKRRAAEQTVAAGEDVMAYNARKQDAVRAIYDRAFVALGLLEG